MFGLGPWELIIIGVLLFVVFGAGRIPEIGKGVGGAVRELRKVRKEMSPEAEARGPEKPDSGPAPEPRGPDLEGEVAGRLLERVPGVRRAMRVKAGVDKVRKVVK
jgi:sec-independent protein translocase protein TatA